MSVVYRNGTPRSVATALVSTQHDEEVTNDEIGEYVTRVLAPRALNSWFGSGTQVLVNPTGRFCQGGPSVDCGVTGRKIIVDTFGTGDERAAHDFVRTFDFRPAAIIERLRLLRPFYRETTNYWHFGKPSLPWEA